jgi:hypothetical protein
MPADLHIHSNASDGELAPAEVARQAKAAGLCAFSLTDHDTTNGLKAAKLEAERSGIVFVPGIEINCDAGERDAHILGYGMSANLSELEDELRELGRNRYIRVQKMVAKLQQLGIPVTLEMVEDLARGATLGRPHVARAIVQLGYAVSVQDAFDRFLVRGAPAYEPRMGLHAKRAIELLHDCGAVVSFAHPAKTNDDTLVEDVIRWGLDALEVWHSDHKSADRERYKRMARKYGLLLTGGSDSHGTVGSRFVPIGNQTLPDEHWEKLALRLGL